MHAYHGSASNGKKKRHIYSLDFNFKAKEFQFCLVKVIPISWTNDQNITKKQDHFERQTFKIVDTLYGTILINEYGVIF